VREGTNTAAAGGAEESAREALTFIEPGQVVGLGTGRAATAFVRALGARVAEGLEVVGVPTSEATATVARELGIPLASLDQVDTIDITFDGADEVDPALDLIKGYGGALVREKIVAASSRRLVILVGSEKCVPILGSRGKLPVEVLPFGEALCRKRLRQLDCQPVLRQGPQDRPYVTDNGNSILDCEIGPVRDAEALERAILAIPGVVGTGLFVGMADAVIIQEGRRVEVRRRPNVSGSK